MVQKTLILVLLLSLGACAYGPKTEKKSPLNILNGENYEQPKTGAVVSSDGVVIPIVKRKERSTEVKGKVMLAAGLGAVPVQGVAVGLFAEDGKMLSNTTSGIGGEFSLKAPVKNGVYKLKTIDEKYSGSYPVAVESYSVTGILFQVQRKD